MSEITIGKRYTFDAAHRLPLHGGKCSRPHGHTYILEVDFTGLVQTDNCNEQGMVLDYYKISEVIKTEIMDRFDHQDLNQVMKPFFNADPEVENCTTAERMVHIFARLIQRAVDGFGVNVTRVRLQETQNSWAECRPKTVDFGSLRIPGRF